MLTKAELQAVINKATWFDTYTWGKVQPDGTVDLWPAAVVLLERGQLDYNVRQDNRLYLPHYVLDDSGEVIHDIEESLNLIGTTVQYCDLLEQKGADVIDNFKSALQLMEEREG